jgi:hypothetical protein
MMIKIIVFTSPSMGRTSLTTFRTSGGGGVSWWIDGESNGTQPNHLIPAYESIIGERLVIGFNGNTPRVHASVDELKAMLIRIGCATERGYYCVVLEGIEDAQD